MKDMKEGTKAGSTVVAETQYRLGTKEAEEIRAGKILMGMPVEYAYDDTTGYFEDGE